MRVILETEDLEPLADMIAARVLQLVTGGTPSVMPAGIPVVEEAPVKPRRTRGPNKPKPGSEPTVPPTAVESPTGVQIPPMTVQPIMQGDVRVFPAQRNQPTQMNGAIDITTNKPIGLPPMPTGPVIPQFNTAPPVVSTVGQPGPVIVNPMVGGVSVNDAKTAALRLSLMDQIPGGGKEALKRAMAMVGIVTVAGITEANAPSLYQAVELVKAGMA